MHDVLLERPDLEALEVDVHGRLERVPVREVLEGDDLANGAGENVDLVHIDERSERGGWR